LGAGGLEALIAPLSDEVLAAAAIFGDGEDDPPVTNSVTTKAISPLSWALRTAGGPLIVLVRGPPSW